jgi:Xaa-Pro aminopeptidase
VAIAYAIVTPKSAMLFTNLDNVTQGLRRALGGHVEVHAYDEIGAACRSLARDRSRVWADAATTNMSIATELAGASIVADPGPIARIKARKNAVEISGMRRAHVRDGVAMVRFLEWLEKAVPRGGVTEISAAAELLSFRARGEYFQGASFRTISGYGAHGAIVHYTVTDKTNVPLRPDGLYLVDSGGHYLDGTTDITRTVLLGKGASADQKNAFTRVLKGVIALTTAVFPEGVRGLRLDTLARRALWDAGLDYGHGTGHGVGMYLNVHEGPQSIGVRCTGVPLEEGNIFSNEPGYYVEGAFGLRIENLILVRKHEAASRAGRVFFTFDTLTMCPIDTRLVEVKLFTTEERRWLNDYHREVKRTLSPHLESSTRAWLARACGAL